MREEKVVALLMIVMFLIIPSYAWWNYSWHYRDAINITYDKDLGYSIVPLYVNTLDKISRGKMNPDCSDIRMLFGDYLPLSYDIKYGCNTSETVIYVLLPNNFGSSNQIFMYYGNPNAVSSESFLSYATVLPSLSDNVTGASCVYDGNEYLCFGGSFSQGSLYGNSIFKIDPDTYDITVMGESLPENLERMSCAYEDQSRKVVCMGGITGSSSYSRYFYVYDIPSGDLTYIDPPEFDTLVPMACKDVGEYKVACTVEEYDTSVGAFRRPNMVLYYTNNNTYIVSDRDLSSSPSCDEFAYPFYAGCFFYDNESVLCTNRARPAFTLYKFANFSNPETSCIDIGFRFLDNDDILCSNPVDDVATCLGKDDVSNFWMEYNVSSDLVSISRVGVNAYNITRFGCTIFEGGVKCFGGKDGEKTTNLVSSVNSRSFLFVVDKTKKDVINVSYCGSGILNRQYGIIVGGYNGSVRGGINKFDVRNEILSYIDPPLVGSYHNVDGDNNHACSEIDGGKIACSCRFTMGGVESTLSVIYPDIGSVYHYHSIFVNTFSREAQMFYYPNLTSLVRYDGNDLYWFFLDDGSYSSADLNLPHSSRSGCSIYGDYLYCFGGEGPSNESYKIDVSNPPNVNYQQLPDAPFSSRFFSCVTVNSTIYCLGGADTNKTFKYYPKTNTFQELSFEMPYVGASSCIYRSKDGKVYCFSDGGTVVQFDPDTEQGSVYDTSGPAPSCEYSSLTDRVYCTKCGGGSTCSGRAVNVYNFDSKETTSMSTYLPNGLMSTSCSQISKDEMICVGGKDKASNPVDYALIFDYGLCGSKFSIRKIPLGFNISDTACAYDYDNGKTYCIGGMTPSGETDIVFTISLSHIYGNVSVVGNISKSVHSMSCVYANGKIICSGGVGLSIINDDIVEIDPITLSSDVKNQTRLPVFDSWCFFSNDRVHCLGGQSSSGKTNVVQWYDVSSNDVGLDSARLPDPASGLGCFYDDMERYGMCFGGEGSSGELGDVLWFSDKSVKGITQGVMYTESVIPPYILNATEPRDPTPYKPDNSYTFKAVVCDDNNNLPSQTDIDWVKLEFDGANYTVDTYSVINSTCAEYRYTFVGLSPKTYSYMWYVYDGIYYDSLGYYTYTVDPNDEPTFSSTGYAGDRVPYNPYIQYEFNATICDQNNDLPSYEDLEWVKFELNGANYTASYNETVDSKCEIFREWFSLGAGTYSFKWYAYDGVHLSVSGASTMEVYETHPPAIESTEEPYDPTTEKIGIPYRFRVFVCDPDNDLPSYNDIKYAVLSFDGTNYTVYSTSVYNSTCEYYYYDLYDLAVGTHTYYWFVTDGIYNQTSSEETFTVVENDPVRITGYYEPPDPTLYKTDNDYTFQSDVCDPNNNLPSYNDVEWVKFEIDGTNYTVGNRILINSSCYRYVLTLVNLNVGVHNYKWYAYDGEYYDSTNQDTFTVSPDTPPDIYNVSGVNGRVEYSHSVNYTFYSLICDVDSNLPAYDDIRSVTFEFDGSQYSMSNSTMINDTCTNYTSIVNITAPGTYDFKWCAYDGAYTTCSPVYNITFYVPSPSSGGGGGGGGGASEIIVTILRYDLPIKAWYCIPAGCDSIDLSSDEVNVTFDIGDVVKGTQVILEYKGSNKTVNVFDLYKKQGYSNVLTLDTKDVFNLKSVSRVSLNSIIMYVLSISIILLTVRRLLTKP